MIPWRRRCRRRHGELQRGRRMWRDDETTGSKHEPRRRGLRRGDARPPPQAEREARAAGVDDDGARTTVGDADHGVPGTVQRDVRGRGRQRGGRRCRGGEDHRPITVNVTVEV